jgi:hypothetical protein
MALSILSGCARRTLSRGIALRTALSYARGLGIVEAEHVQQKGSTMLRTGMANETVRWIDGAAQVLIGATAVAAACIALAGTGTHARGDIPPGRFRLAMQAYEAQQWPQAYAQLAAAADAGDPSAARVALMMAHQGPLLFGQRFDVSPGRLTRWNQALNGQLDAASSMHVIAPGPAFGHAVIGERAAESERTVQVAGAR